MKPNVITLEDALDHLENKIPDTADCKKEIIDLLKWVIAWNADRSQDNHIFSFLREFKKQNKDERVNVAFAIDRDSNRLKTKKPNYIVIKLADTDQEFKDIHADFDLSELGYSQLLQYLTQRESNPRRWVASCSEISRMGFDNFQRLFLVAYERKGGIA